MALIQKPDLLILDVPTSGVDPVARDVVLLPLQVLSGGMTPRESMPEWVQQTMMAAPTTHFVMLSQGILFRGGGIEVVWPQFLALAVIGTVLFGVALAHFRKTLGTMA